MRNARIAVLVVLVGSLAVSCGGITSYDETEAVTITVNAADRLNEYSGEPHALVVYSYKVDDPDLFLGADEGALIADIGKPVAGGVVHQTRTFSPGDGDVVWRVGAMGQEKYQWVGIYAAYRDAVGSRRAVFEIPVSAELSLDLAAKGIEKFGELD